MKWLIMGTVLGAGAALLYAPRTGRRTRAFLRQKSAKIARRANVVLSGKRRHLLNKVEGWKAKMLNLSDDLNYTFATAALEDI